MVDSGFNPDDRWLAAEVAAPESWHQAGLNILDALEHHTDKSLTQEYLQILEILGFPETS